MFVFIHGERHQAGRHQMTVCPAADKPGLAGHPAAAEWLDDDGVAPRQIEVSFVGGRAEVPDNLGDYMIRRGLAHKKRWSGLVTA